MVMTVVELEKIMIEKCIAIRAIPKEVRGIYEKSNFERFSNDSKHNSEEIMKYKLMEAIYYESNQKGN